MKSLILRSVVGVMLVLMISSCQTVRPYQRVYLNDFEMKPGYPGARAFEQYVQIIREGSSGGGGAKTSGGCGCN